MNKWVLVVLFSGMNFNHLPTIYIFCQATLAFTIPLVLYPKHCSLTLGLLGFFKFYKNNAIFLQLEDAMPIWDRNQLSNSLSFAS